MRTVLLICTPSADCIVLYLYLLNIFNITCTCLFHDYDKIASFFYFLVSRIPKDCHGNSNWICHHGLHWILCQTHPHPHQQHHCVSNPQKTQCNSVFYCK